MLDGIAHVELAVRSLSDSRSLYERLGLSSVGDGTASDTDHACLLEVGPSILELRQETVPLPSQDAGEREPVAGAMRGATREKAMATAGIWVLMAATRATAAMVWARGATRVTSEAARRRRRRTTTSRSRASACRAARPPTRVRALPSEDANNTATSQVGS